MGKASRRKQLDEQRKQFFAIHGDGRSAEDRTNARAMLDALQKKLEDDALREDGFYFVNGKYADSRRPRLTSGMKTRGFENHRSSIMDIEIVRINATSPHEKDLMLLFTFGLDCVSIWNLSTGTLLGSLDVSSFCARSICGGAARSQNCSLDTVVFAYATYNEPILHYFDPRKNAIVPASAPARAFDVASNFCTSHQQAISAVAFSHDAELLASSSWDSTCMLWKVTTVNQETKHTGADSNQEVGLTLLMVLPVHEEGASCLAFTVDDQALVACGECVVKLWDISDVSSDNQEKFDRAEKAVPLGAQLLEWQQAIPFSISIESSTNFLAFDESMSALASNHEWCHVHKRDETMTLLAPAQSEEDRNKAIDVKQCLDQIIEEIDPKTDEMEMLLGVNPVGVTDKEKGVKSENNSPRDILEKDPHALTAEESARLKTQFRTMEDFDFERLFTPALSLSLDSSGSLDSIPARTVTRKALHPNANGRLIRTFLKQTVDGKFSSHSSTITGCAVAQELGLVVTVALDRSVRYWSLEHGVVLETVFDAHDAAITCCALTSPTTCDLSVYEMLLATGGSDNVVKVWRRNEPQRAECVFSLAGHNDAIRSVAFDPNGVFLVSASEDTTAIMWRVRPSSPDQPETPIVVLVDRFSIDISWTEPLANGAKILHYIVRTTQVSSFTGDGKDILAVPDVEVPAKYLSKTIEKLQPGVKYTLEISAVNHIGRSEFSVATKPIETLAFIPSRIGNPVQHDHREATRITLSWTAPCPNGAAIVSYTIQCRPENSAFIPLRQVTIPVADLKVSYPDLPAPITRRASKVAVPIQRQSAAVLSYTVDELWAGEVYQFVVAASNRCGLGEFSHVSDYVKMDCMAPDQPAKPELVRVDKRQLDVEWIKPRCNGSDVLQYTLRWRQEIEGSPSPHEQTIVLLTRSIAGTKYTLTGLEPGSPVQVWVSASNLVDNKLLTSLESLPSEPVATLCDVPDTPAAPNLLEPTAHTLLLAWAPPKRNGLPIDAYNVALYSEETQFGVRVRQLSREFTLQPHDFQLSSSGAATVSFVLHHLRGGTFYSATITARNSLGASGVSDAGVPAQTSTPTVPDVIPNAPVVSDVTPTSAVVVWKLPVHDGGAALRGFHVEYTVRSNRSDARGQDRMESGGDITVSRGLELKVTFLKPHRVYQFRVSPENRIGRASPSAWSSEVATPSLVEFTVTRYFAYRPPEEHDAARFIQRRYRAWKKKAADETRFTAALVLVLRHWHL